MHRRKTGTERVSLYCKWNKSGVWIYSMPQKCVTLDFILHTGSLCIFFNILFCTLSAFEVSLCRIRVNGDAQNWEECGSGNLWQKLVLSGTDKNRHCVTEAAAAPSIPPWRTTWDTDLASTQLQRKATSTNDHSGQCYGRPCKFE